MPAISLVCPHCEKPVNVQVTAVTRSRPCPHCDATLLLQVAEGTGVKRKALLVAPKQGAVIPQAEAVQPTAEVLAGDPFERMRMDPQLQRMRTRLWTGVALMACGIAVVTGLRWANVDLLPRAKGPGEVVKVDVGVEPVIPQPVVVPIAPMMSLEERLEKMRAEVEAASEEEASVKRGKGEDIAEARAGLMRSGS